METKNTESVKNIPNAQLIMQKEILSFNEALVYLDVSASFLYKLTSKKAVEFTKPNGGKIYFSKKDLNNWMLSNTSQSKKTLETEILKHLKKNNNG